MTRLTPWKGFSFQHVPVITKLTSLKDMFSILSCAKNRVFKLDKHIKDMF